MGVVTIAEKALTGLASSLSIGMAEVPTDICESGAKIENVSVADHKVPNKTVDHEYGILIKVQDLDNPDHVAAVLSKMPAAERGSLGGSLHEMASADAKVARGLQDYLNSGYTGSLANEKYFTDDNLNFNSKKRDLGDFEQTVASAATSVAEAVEEGDMAKVQSLVDAFPQAVNNTLTEISGEITATFEQADAYAKEDVTVCVAPAT